MTKYKTYRTLMSAVMANPFAVESAKEKLSVTYRAVANANVRATAVVETLVKSAA